MRRGVFEALFISALTYTVIASAAMPTRAHETVVYPVKPMEERNVDSFLDKVRRSIFTQIRAAAQEARIERANNDAADGDYATADADSGDTGQDLLVDVYAECDDTGTDSGRVEEAEGAVESVQDGGDSADPVLTEWQYYGNCRITHYDAGPCCCGEWATGCTASGVLATTHHTVASGPDLPFGTEVMINGEVYVVEDRGVDEYQIDIFVDTHEEALAMGMYYAEVFIRG